MYRETLSLIKKEFTLEWRQRYSLAGLLLYIVSTVFVCYLSFKRISTPTVWNALFWIIQLFTAINAIAKSFMQESSGRKLYYYTLANPVAVIFSKIIYNILLMIALSVVSLVFFSFFIGSDIQDMPLFMATVILGSAGFSAILSVMSAITSKAGSNATLMSVLSLPVLLPMLIITIKLSKNAVEGLDLSTAQPYLIMLAGINVLSIALAYILFPYLWKE